MRQTQRETTKAAKVVPPRQLESADVAFVVDMLHVASDTLLECSAAVTARCKRSDVVERFKRSAARARDLADTLES